MAEANNLTSTVEALFKGVNGIVSTKTVVGDAITIDNVTIVPLIDVSFGMGAGEFDGEKKEKRPRRENYSERCSCYQRWKYTSCKH